MTLKDQISKGLEQVHGKLSSIGKGMGTAGVAVASLATIVGGKAVQAFASFEHQMSELGSVSGATAEQMRMLSEKAKQIGADTSLSTGQAGTALTELAKAGLTVPDILGGAADATVVLAESGGLAMDSAASIASAAKNSFGLAASEMANVADLASGAANASATDVSLWGESIKEVGPTARTVGLDIKETTHWIAAMAKTGVIGSQAGNSMKRAMLELAAPSDKAASLMKELGFSAFDAGGKLKDLPKLASDLQGALGNLNPQAQAEALNTMFGSFGLQAGSALLREGAAGINEIAKAVGNVSAADVAKEKLDNFAGSMEILKGSVETFLITLGEGLTPLFRPFVDLATQAVNALLPLAGMLGSIPAPILTLIATMAPLVAGFASIKAVTSFLPEPLQGVANSLTKFAGPISLLIPLAAALFMAYQTNFMGLRTAVEPIVTSITNALNTGKIAIQTFMQGFTFGGGLANPFTAIQLGLDALVTKFPEAKAGVDAVKSAISLISPVVTAVVSVFTTFGTFLASHKEILLGVAIAYGTFKTAMTIQGVVTQVIAGLQKIAASNLITGLSFQGLGAMAQGAWTAIGGPLGLLAIAIGIFAAAWAGNWGGIREKVASAVEFIKAHLDQIINVITLIAPPIGIVLQIWRHGWDGIRAKLAEVAGWIGTKLQELAIRLGVPKAAVQALAAVWPGIWASIASAAIGFIDSILNKLGPLGDAIRKLGGMIGLELPGAVQGGFVQTEQMLANGAKGNAQRVVDATEQTLIGGRQRVGAGAKAMVSAADDAIKQKSIDAASAAKAAGEDISGGLSEGLGGGGGGGAADAAAGAGADPVQTAMQTISSVAQAVTAGLDAAEKMFTFRGSPPAELMDEVFAMLKDMADRAIELAADIGPEIAQQAGAAWQMLSTVTQTLQSMVDLGNKLARFRVPTVENMGAIKDMAKAIAKIALEITDMFLKGDLQANLEDLAIGQKVAENLKAWTDLLKDMAEATGAIARARLDVDMGPVFNFIHQLVDMALALTQELKLRLGAKLRVLLADTKDVADTLKPWAELLKMSAEVTKSLITSRWPTSFDAPTKFFTDLADMAIRMVETMRTRLGPTILLALEDSKEIAESIKPWADILKDISAVTESVAKARTGTPLEGVGAFLIALLGQVVLIRQTALSQLGSGLLVALEDSKEIAGVLKEWFDPIKQIGEVALAIDVARRVSSDRTDTTLTALLDMLLGIANVTGSIVQRAWAVLGDKLLISLEDSKAVAELFKTWLEPISKVGEAAKAIDVARGLAQQRYDTSAHQLSQFLLSVASATAGIVNSAWQALGEELIRQFENSKAVAETFKTWMEPLAKVGEVAISIDRMRGLAQQRFDTTMGTLVTFLLSIGTATAALITGVQMGADPQGRLAVSKAVAETFGPWLEVIIKAKDSAEAVLRMPTNLPEDAFAKVESLLVSISSRTSKMVTAVARDADPEGLLAISRAVAETFGAWLDLMAKVGTATEALAGMVNIPESAIDDAINLMVRIAGRTSVFVKAVARDADPGPLQELSQQVAATFGAWIDVIAKVAQLTVDLVKTEPVDPAKLDIVENAMSDLWDRLGRIAAPITGMDRVSREDLIPALQSYIDIAGGAVGLFSDMANATKAISQTVPMQAGDFVIIENAIVTILDKVKAMAHDFMPKIKAESLTMSEELKAYVEIAGSAVGLFADAASIGKDTEDAVAVSTVSIGAVKKSIERIVAMILPMANAWAEAQINMTQSVANAKGFGDAANSALGVVKGAVDAILALTNNDIGTIDPGALSRVGAGIKRIMVVIETLSKGYRDAKGRLDETRMGAIKGFSDSVNAAVGAVKGTVELLEKLTESQGMLGGMTGNAQVLIRAAITQVISMMESIALEFDMATHASRRSLERTAEFSKIVGEVMGGVDKVIGTVKNASEFFASDAAAQSKDKGFVERVKSLMTSNITMMITTLDQVLSDVGPKMIADANAVAIKVGPIAENLGKMIEPIQKLLANPFANVSKRAAMAKTSSQFGGLVNGDLLGRRLAAGLQKMVGAIIAGLEGIKVPGAVPAGLIALMDLVANVVGIITQAMALPEIDFGKISDIRRAAEILAGTNLGGGGAGAGQGAGSGSGVPGGGAGLGPFLVNNGQFIGTMTMPGASMLHQTLLDGKVIHEIQKTETFQIGEARASQEAAGV